MAYDDYYVDRNTMKGNCDVQITGTYPSSDEVEDSPGQPAGTKFIAPGEDITSSNANRARYQLAHNDDILKARLDDMKALTQRALLSSFSGSSLTIDPDAGVGSNIDFATAGYLYVGNSNYSGATQDDFDALFQFMDASGNEVMFDGEEVKVVAISGAALGGGFVNGGIITLTLGTDSTAPSGVALPSANYLLKYARETTLSTLPDDALIAAEIRGGHEGSGENQKPMWAVCAPAGGRGDYVGDSAFGDAVANGEEMIYLKAGTYGPLTADTALNAVKYIMGEHVDTVFIQIAGNYNMTSMPSGSGFTVEVTSAVANNNYVTLAGGAVIRDVFLRGLRLWLNSNVVVENVLCGGYSGALYAAANTYNVKVSNLLYDATDHASGQLFYFQEGCTNLEFDNVRPVPGASLSTQENCIWFSGPAKSKRIRFSNCYFETAGQSALNAGNDVDDITFSNCVFESDDASYPTVLLGGNTGVVLDTCYVSQLSATSTTNNEPLYLSGVSNSVFRNCVASTAATRRAVYALGSVYNTTFENCEFSNDSPNYPTFGLYGGARELTFNGCKFTNAATTSTGVNPTFQNDTVLEKSSFSGCVFDGAFGKALDLTGIVRYVDFRDCEFTNDSTSSPTIHVQAAVSNSSFENCTVTQSAASTVSLNAALAVAAAVGESSFENCKFDGGFGKALDVAADMERVALSNCLLQNDSADNPTLHINNGITCTSLSFSNCEFNQADGTTEVNNHAFYMLGTLRDSFFQGCRFVSAADTALDNVDDLFHRVSFSGCYFEAKKTVVNIGYSSTRAHIAFFQACSIVNTATTWYNTRAVTLRGEVHDVYTGGSYDAGTGISFDGLYIQDSYSQGHNSPNDPSSGSPPTGGSAGIPVIDFYGVSGRGLAINRGTMTYNVENGPWLELEHCNIEEIGVRVTTASAMTPVVYDTGGSSGGMIEVKGSSMIRGLRYGLALKGEVSRPIIYAKANNSFEDTEDANDHRGVLIENVEACTENAAAWWSQSSPYAGGLLLTMDGGVTVRHISWSSACKVATRTDASSIGETTVLIMLKGSHNTLERAFVSSNGTSRGTILYPILVGVSTTDYSPRDNVLRDCVMSVNPGVPPDAGGVQYPKNAIRVIGGHGTVIEGCRIEYTDAPLVLQYPVSMNAYTVRFSNNYIHVDDALGGGNEFLAEFGSSRKTSCTCVGNVFRGDSGTLPTLVDAPPSATGNAFITEATP